MSIPRRYVVVIATQGGTAAPPHVMEVLDAYDPVEATKQLMVETIGRYGCDVRGVVYCRPATLGCLRRAAEILAEEGLRQMPSVGNVH